MLARRSWCAWILGASLTTGCGARSALEVPEDAAAPVTDAASAVAFPVGEYTDCASGIYAPTGGILGADREAVLSITQDGRTLHARYVDQNGARSAFDFTVTTGATASLVPGGAGVQGAPHPCVRGVGSVLREPATLVADEGALVADRDAVFLAVQGTATDVAAGPCGVRSDRQALWIACRRRDRTAPVGSVSPSAEAFSAGTFACQSQVATWAMSGGTQQFLADGAMGSLSLAQRGATLALTYSGERAATGQADLSVISGTAALLRVGRTLFVSVVGTTVVPCDGAEKFVTLRCELP